MWDFIRNAIRAAQNYVIGMESWDWGWLCAVAVLIGWWSLRSMPAAGSR
jgi:hypothetical protein